MILDGPFNDITPWNDYHLPEVLGSGHGFVVETVEQLDAALAAARAHTPRFSLLDVRLDPRDISPALRRLTERLAQHQGHEGRPELSLQGLQPSQIRGPSRYAPARRRWRTHRSAPSHRFLH